jgi:hypothetical protein
VERFGKSRIFGLYGYYVRRAERFFGESAILIMTIVFFVTAVLFVFNPFPIPPLPSHLGSDIDVSSPWPEPSKL